MRQVDLLAGVAGAAATVPLLALGLTMLRGQTRAAFRTGAEAMLAAALGAAIVAAARGGSAPWRGVAAVEALANAVLALACLCALVPPLNARLGTSRNASAVAALAGAAIVLRGGLALGLQTGLAVRDDAVRAIGIAVGVALVCVATAALVAALRRARPRTVVAARPWLIVTGGVVAVSTAVGLACAERVLFPIQLRASAGSTFVSSGSFSEAVLQGVTGIAHSVPRAQVAAIAVALVVGAALATWKARGVHPLAELEAQ